jgi:pyridinium-3,5-bisthiocarboxylic acid mononucleotide nickel chelatase
MSSQRIMFVDPWSGLSGDMFLASLVDSDRSEGRLERVLEQTVQALGIPDAGVRVNRDTEWGVACTRVQVDEGEAPPLRHLHDMEDIVSNAALPSRVIARSLAALRRLAEVEAGIHGCGVDEIHFHEVGAVDTLVDVVGTIALVEALDVSSIVVGTIPVGGGTVEIAHGRMGVPAPATARLLEGYPIVGGPEPRELTTPTGALLVGQLGAVPGPLPDMTVEAIGHGAGSMKLEKGPNLLRVLVGRARSEWPAHNEDRVVELQTNLDDVSGEVVGNACRLLREAGALDVWTVPAMMKKERPAVVMHTLVAPELEATAIDVLFRQTGSLGIRRQTVERHLADRGHLEVEVQGERVRVKWGRWNGRLTSVAAEYEDAVAVAERLHLPLKEVMEAAAGKARAILGPQAHPA